MVGPLLAGLAMGSSEGVPAGARLADSNAALLIAGIVSVLAVPFAFGTAAKQAPGDRMNETAPSRPDSFSALLRYPTVRTNMVASLALLATTDILVAFLPLLASLGRRQRRAPSNHWHPAGNPCGCVHCFPPTAAGPSRPLEPGGPRRSQSCGSGNYTRIGALVIRAFVGCSSAVGCRRVLSGLGTANHDSARCPGRSARFQRSSTCPPPARQQSRPSRPPRRGGTAGRSGRAQRGALDVLRHACSRMRTLAG